MANTTNLNLVKLSGSEKLKTYPTNQAGNMDTIDSAFGAGFGLSGKPSVNTSINNLADGLAIVANGNTHAAITSGQYVYVRNHGSLSEGLYVATANISANGTLSGSNLTADTAGGLNAINSKIAREFASNTDLNSYSVYDDRQNAYYYGTNISAMTNRPAAETNTFPFTLDVSNNGSYIIQKIVVYTANGVPNYYIRQQYYSYGTKIFGDWQLLALNSNIVTTTVDYSYSYTISANGDISITAGQMGMNSVPTGYQPRAISFYNTGNVNVFARGINSRETTTNSNCVWLHNASNSQVSATMSVTVFYTKV